MKNILFTGLALAALTFASSCKKDQNSNDTSFGQRSTKASYASASALPVQTVSGSITTNTTWDNSKVWEVSGVLTVKDGATLTIEAGTYIKSTVNTVDVPNGIIVVQKGGKISAIGTAENPIVFTSRYKLGDATKAPAPGDFGGIILLGKAHVNTGTKYIEGLTGTEYSFGGDIENDNSGTIKYARIEYAGFNLTTDNEVNGLTCGGVGNQTTLDYIEVNYGRDDSFEFFGGSVNASHLVSKAADDDNFDFDNGYNGSITFAVAIADKNSTHSLSGGNSDSNGIESDNNSVAESPTFSLLPRTRPVLSNISIIGTSTLVKDANGKDLYKFAVRNRRGAEIELYDSIITGYPSGFVFDGTTPGASVLDGNDFHGFNAAITPAGAYAGNNQVTGSPASPFGMTQPFYNDGTVNLFGATKGAFPNSSNWAASWSTL
ncbi:hypothetical protein [Pedobacter caeni]|uniref:T9SS C-terminal target domain-containing protein n=1 Tax=Pedobacter caeni TaxID=288992 RepID=A0A1M5G798_9SPHI|nr:hypothetical protein [Pedobacter caeni]SHF99341.1 hypothetical protein SAMN04488522_10480 [Pedobacter caeni]